jgi:hypothetical protein
MTGEADWKLEFLVDKSGVISGVRDLHSRSQAEGIRNIPDKGNRYSDW